MRIIAAVSLGFLVAACHDAPQKMPPPPCTFVCSTPSFTKLDRLAGQPGGAGWVDAVGPDAHFADPWTMTSDGAGRLFLADGEMIRAIDLATLRVTTLAGSYSGVGGMDGVGAQATFNTPSGLAFYGGSLYVTDTENHTIRKIDPASGAVTTIAGAFGIPGTTDDVGTAARFREPEGIAADASGNLYIADVDNNTIRKMVIATGQVSTVAGTAGTSGTTDATGMDARFSKPKELTVSGQSLYIVDSLNNSVRKMDLVSFQVSTVATFQTQPGGLAVSGTDLLVSLGDDTLVRIALANGAVTALAGASGDQGFVDGAAADARFNQPTGLFLDPAGDLLVADNGNDVLRKVALGSGMVSTFAGAKSSGSADGAGAQARFFAPGGLAATADAIYVADTGNQTLRKIAIATGETTTLAGAVGQAGNASGALADARFNQPEGLALDTARQILYVADSGNRSLRRIDLTAGMVTTLVYNKKMGDPFTALSAPWGLALAGGRLYVSDNANHDVVALDPDAQVMATVAGKEGVPGPADGVGGQARFYGPEGIAADEAGHLYVADDLNDTIRQIDLATGKVSTVAGLAQTTGAADGVGGAARLAFPVGVAVDGAGDLYVADSLNDTIRHVALASGAVSTLIGVPHLPGVALGPLPAQLSQPGALALTPAGALALVSENSLLFAH